MSNSSDPWHPGVAADIEATYSTLFLPQLSYIEFGCLMLVIYEYLLTFSTEYYQIWCRKWTIPSVLYLVNRYTLYLLVPTTWFADYMAPDSSVSTMLQCSIAQGFHLTFVFILGTVTTVFMVLRVHAINTGNGQWFWTVLLILMTLIAIPFIMGCGKSYSIGLVGTTIVAGITLYRTAASALAARKANLPNSLSYYLLRDGTTYYLYVVWFTTGRAQITG
ncbi:hypothetical protein C8Q74DRAFT_1393524 [Fomes fomentarius]|nr:hypothetical protein C8Q74DRAFT_1393524 [Fomes fomentarius]